MDAMSLSWIKSFLSPQGTKVLCNSSNKIKSTANPQPEGNKENSGEPE